MRHIIITQQLQPTASWQAAFGNQYQLVEDVTIIDWNSVDFVWLHNEYPDVLNVIKHIKSKQKPVVIMSLLPDAMASLTYLRAGALGCCHALASPATLTQVMDSVKAGGVWMGVELMQQVMQKIEVVRPLDEKNHLPVLDVLTAKEREVVHYVVKGLTNKEVALKMDISDRTVKAHLASVFSKLNVKDRIHLTLLVRQ